MVKGFGSSELKTSEDFMTCADVPALAVEGVIEDPINPFTGKENQFLPGNWYTVQDDMRKPENWKLVAEDTVLPEKN